jgi:hypothetical protein
MAVRKLVFAGVGALMLSSLAAAGPMPSALVAGGKPVAQTRADLDACLARQCSTPEDIAATIALGDALVAASEWTEAARVLSAGRDRNRKFAASHPVEVAEMLRAFGHVSWLRGQPGQFRMAALDTVDALKEGLGGDDPRVLMARIEVADMISYAGVPYNTAENKYQAAIADARARGLPRIEGLAMYRRAAMYTWAAVLDRGSFERRADEGLDALIASKVPEHLPYVRAAKVLKGQLATYFGNDEGSKALIAALRAQPKVNFELLAYEPVERTNLMTREGPRASNQTFDLAYFVSPDGRVRGNVLSLQYERRDIGGWDKAIAASIRSRRYAPLGLDAADPGVMRIERYTVTGGGEVPIRVEMRVLTDDGTPIEVPTKIARVNK